MCMAIMSWWAPCAHHPQLSSQTPPQIWWHGDMVMWGYGVARPSPWAAAGGSSRGSWYSCPLPLSTSKSWRSPTLTPLHISHITIFSCFRADWYCLFSPQIVPKWTPNVPLMVPDWSPNGSEFLWSGPRMVPNWSRNGLQLSTFWFWTFSKFRS